MLQAQPPKSRQIKSAERKDDALFLYSDYGIMRLSPKTEKIIRVSFICNRDFSPETGVGIVYDEAFSDWSFSQENDIILLKTSSLILQICAETGSIKYFDINNKLLLKERKNESKILEEFDSFKTIIDTDTEVENVKTADGVKKRIEKSNKVFDKKLFHTRLFLDWQEDEALFGLGQHEQGVLNWRGTTQYLHQANLKIAVPFLISTKNYGILLATGSPVIFNDTAYGSYLYTEADIQMDFYFIAGDNFDEIIKGYRLLSGKAVMLPKWAFGYVQSQERYETAEELINIAKEYRRRGIGMDCLVLDWFSWEDGMWGQKTFDKSRFPDPAAMMNEIHSLNAHLIMSVWPNMNEKSDNYREFAEAGLLLPGNDLHDPFCEAGRKLYWKQVNEGLFTHGLDGWWCDSSEPFTPEWFVQTKPEASMNFCKFLQEANNFMPAEKANAYALFQARGIYEGQRGVTDQKRVLNLTRSSYTGQQKYGTVLWSGDTCASWETLQKQIVAGLNFCASGLPYWTLDIGAFFVKKGFQWYWAGEYDAGTDDLGYRELYTRWFQYSVFLPMLRAHGTDVRREVWAFGEASCEIGEMFYDALVKAIELRYSLIPYIYSTAADVWLNDSTMLRMLAFDFPNDKKALEIKDQYMFGKSIMVCPVTSPMYYEKNSKPVNNAKSRKVYLPEGTKWYDFYTNELYDGDTVIEAEADITKIPLFVKAGSIIPVTKPMNYVDEDLNVPIELRVYTGADCEFMLYDDDGNTYNYEKGEYSLVRITWNDSAGELKYEEVNKGARDIIGRLKTVIIK